MTGRHADFWVCRSEFAQARRVWSQHRADQPIRHVLGKVGRRCISDVEQPAGFDPYGNAAVATRMSEQRHQPHLRFEWQANRCQVEPAFTSIIIKHKFRLMGDVAADISQVDPLAWAPRKGFVLAVVDMDAGMWKIRQAAAVIEMHVGQHNMTQILRLVAEMRDLARNSFFRVQGQNRENLKRANDARLVDVIINP